VLLQWAGNEGEMREEKDWRAATASCHGAEDASAGVELLEPSTTTQWRRSATSKACFCKSLTRREQGGEDQAAAARV